MRFHKMHDVGRMVVDELCRASRIRAIVIIFALSVLPLCASGLPYEFTYDGKHYRGYEGVIDGLMKVSVERAEHPDFDQYEYTVWFENIGDRPTSILEDVYALKETFKGSDPVLRGCMGDHENFYRQYSTDLTKTPSKFVSTEGRASHIVFPYFDLLHGNEGTRIALGWAGTWEANFTATGKQTLVEAKTNLGLKTVLMPGEKIRTGLVVLLNYKGRDEHTSINKWRQWFMKYNLPKADANGDDIKPFWTTCFAGDTGLPNSDGSISETYFTWQRTLKKLEHEKLLPDFRWFDAGWYFDPACQTVKSDWWGTIGSWELDTVKWPGNSFRESNDACHALGVKVLAWFEPERVTHVEDLEKNFGYNPEWAIKTDRCITSNIGDSECLQWTLERITRMMGANGIDMYREDNNSDPAAAWKILDSRDEEQYGLPRQGINENKCIQGHYKLWDGILAFCAKNGKCTFMDSCASGGGRNDIESLRRGVPLMRSDYDRTTSAMRLAQSAGFNKWIPFHGSAVKDTQHQLEDSEYTPDSYVVRASLLPILNVSGSYTHNPNLDFDAYRNIIATWESVNHLLTKDFYQLSPWHGHTDTDGWTVYAYNDPLSGEGIVTAFRQETCAEDSYEIALPFVLDKETYSITDDDTGHEWTIGGKDLKKGVKITLPQPRSSILWHIMKI